MKVMMKDYWKDDLMEPKMDPQIMKELTMKELMAQEQVLTRDYWKGMKLDVLMEDMKVGQKDDWKGEKRDLMMKKMMEKQMVGLMDRGLARWMVSKKNYFLHMYS